MVQGKAAAASRTIALSGYYGFDNSGDEAVLQSILLALEEQGKRHSVRFEPVVLSIDPEKTARTYGVRAVHRMRPAAVFGALRGAVGLISGGGSLLQDETSAKTIPYYIAVLKMAQWLGKPTFIYSQGIGPVHRKLFYPWIRSAFSRSAYVSVRDEESAGLLQRMGLPADRIEVVPDPVMGMPMRGERAARIQGGDKGPIIGVSVRFWNEDRSELSALAASLQLIMAQRPDARLRFLPFHLPLDEKASEFIMSKLDRANLSRIEIARGVTHPQDMLAEVSGCSLLIGMRLHSLIYAATQSVPMMGISYDPKIDQFLNRLQMSSAASTASGQFHTETFARTAIELLEDGDAWRLIKQPAIERLKAEAQRPAESIARFFTGG